MGGKKAVPSETVPGKKAEAYISACKERLRPVSSQSVENKEENICRELGDNPAPAEVIEVQKKQNVLVRRKAKAELYPPNIQAEERWAESYPAQDREPYRSCAPYPAEVQGFAGQSEARMYQRFYVQTAPTLSEAYKAFVKAKKLIWTPASAKDIPPIIKQFVEIIKESEHGRDIYITDLGREHIRNYFEILKNLPNRTNKNVYQNKSWHQLAEMGRKGMADRLLGTKTLEGRQINIRSFY